MAPILKYTAAFVQFDPPLTAGRLIRRYKRFLTDVELDDGRVVTAHCTNTGSLRGCLREGAAVLLEPADSPHRKLKWTWKMVRVGRAWVGVDTGMAVPLVEEAIGQGVIPELGGYERSLREVPYGRQGRSRIDVLLSRGGRPDEGRGRRRLHVGDERVYVEVKSTTLLLEEHGDEAVSRMGAFPDAVTERGLKHLHELIHIKKAGHRAAMVYCAQRSDVTAFTSADAIDPAYGKALREAVKAGVEIYALAGRVGPRRITLSKRLPIRL
jgi:sugar fermentation stimulation protein A